MYRSEVSNSAKRQSLFYQAADQEHAMQNQNTSNTRFCPDCGTDGALGLDRFRHAMPCLPCALHRMERALNSDLRRSVADAPIFKGTSPKSVIAIWQKSDGPTRHSKLRGLRASGEAVGRGHDPAYRCGNMR